MPRTSSLAVRERQQKIEKFVRMFFIANQLYNIASSNKYPSDTELTIRVTTANRDNLCNMVRVFAPNISGDKYSVSYKHYHLSGKIRNFLIKVHTSILEDIKKLPPAKRVVNLKTFEITDEHKQELKDYFESFGSSLDSKHYRVKFQFPVSSFKDVYSENADQAEILVLQLLSNEKPGIPINVTKVEER